MASLAKGTLAALAVILLAQLAIHAILLDRLFVNDEGHYIAYSWFTSKGEVMYRDYFEHRPPLLEFISAPVVLLFGPSLGALRLLPAAAMLGTAILVFIIARKLYGENAAVLSCAAFALGEPLFFGFQFLAEPFLSLALAASAALIIFRSAGKEGGTWLALAGIASGAALLLKPQAIIFIAAAAAILYLDSRKPAPVLAFIAGALAVFLPVCAYFALNGALTAFLYHAYAFSILEANGTYAHLAPSSAYDAALLLFLFFPALAYAVSLTILSKSVSLRNKLILFAWLASSLAFAFPRLDTFHLLPALPALAVMPWNVGGPVRRGVALGFALIIIAALALVLFSTGGEDSRIALDKHAAAYLASRTQPDEKIFVAPFTPQVYAYANRGHASKYLSLGPWFMGPEMEREVIGELEAEKPRYIYYMNGTFEQGRTMADYAPELYGYIFTEYEVEESYGPSAILTRKAI